MPSSVQEGLFSSGIAVLLPQAGPAAGLLLALLAARRVSGLHRGGWVCHPLRARTLLSALQQGPG